MWLKRLLDGKSYKANISKVNREDYETIEQSDQFSFNWRIEQEHEIYKIYLIDDMDEILGLISLEDIQREFRIHIHLIEISERNIGKGKEIDWIAGCLIAYACKIAFDHSYDGFVSLMPKTTLVEHYQTKYGFRQVGNLLAVDFEESSELVQTYLLE